MSQSEILVLARQGNIEAITALMNRKLQPAGITVSATGDRGYLMLNLNADRVPNRPALIAFVRKAMGILKVEGIEAVQVAGWQTGASAPAWAETLYFNTQAATLPPPATYAPPSPATYAPPSPATYDPPSPATYAPPTERSSPSPYPLTQPRRDGIVSPSGDGGGAAGFVDADLVPQSPFPDALAVGSSLNEETTEIYTGEMATSTGDPSPEQRYEAWIRDRDQLGFLYQVQIPNLAEFLVYFLLPQESLVDLTGVRYNNRMAVLLMTDQRLTCLTITMMSGEVREAFTYLWSEIGSAEVDTPGLRLVTRDGQYLLYFDRPAVAATFVDRSLAKFVPTSRTTLLPSDRHSHALATYGWAAIVGLLIFILLLHRLFGG